MHVVGAISAKGIWHETSYSYHFYDVQCYGTETNFFDCQYKTTGSCSASDSGAVAVFCQFKS